MSKQHREIKNKNVFLCYLWMFLTFGIYAIVWNVKAKRDMNALGADIPTSWLLIVPFANFYWMYKFCDGFSNHIRKDNNTIMWFVMSLFVGFLMPFFVQSELNKFATEGNHSKDSTPQLEEVAA